jgi:hypothetical protein
MKPIVKNQKSNYLTRAKIASSSCQNVSGRSDEKASTQGEKKFEYTEIIDQNWYSVRKTR